jgi:hypothetical protein
MSRVNKVNPGKYTQAGRLSPDDSAREMAKQREAFQGPDVKANPKSRSEAWMYQAEQAREIKALPPAQFGWGERLLSGLGAISAGLGALGIVAGRQATRYPQLHLQGQEARVRTAAFLMANAAAIALSVYCTQRYMRR